MNTKRQQLLQEFFETLACLKRAIQKGRSFPFDGCTLTKGQTDILMYIAHHKDGVSVKELAEYLGVTSGAITQAIDGLVENKLVQRVEKESDRRVQIITLTPKAHETFRSFKKSYYHDLAPMFETLSDEEIVLLTQLLKKVDSTKTKGGECK
ncbi:MarR family transcriptional regulator [Candidatus Microgenomates bacterium]|nr:MarR family transcriptional regulator [Candidatus Microgenomates bacterium]